MGIENYPLIVVTPVYEDTEACSHLFADLAKEFGDQVYVIAVDDGSLHHPLDAHLLDDAGLHGAVIRLKRNVGHQRAITIGLGYVSEHATDDQRVIVMDSDGEDVPASIRTLLKPLDKSDIDVVVAERRSRVETFRFKAFYRCYRWFFNVMTGRKISFGNFMALKLHSIKRLICMQELPLHVASTILASKLRTEVCSIDRGPRYAGESKMNFVGLALHGFKALMVFAEDVLVRVGIACAGIASMAVLVAMTVTVLKILGFSTPGWFSTVFGLMVLLFLQTGTLTLMTLMLTGVVRSGAVTTALAYHEFVDDVIFTDDECSYNEKCTEVMKKQA